MEEKWEGRDCGGNENTIGSGRGIGYFLFALFSARLLFSLLRVAKFRYIHTRARDTHGDPPTPHRPLKNGQLNLRVRSEDE